MSLPEIALIHHYPSSKDYHLTTAQEHPSGSKRSIHLFPFQQLIQSASASEGLHKESECRFVVSVDAGWCCENIWLEMLCSLALSVASLLLLPGPLPALRPVTEDYNTSWQSRCGLCCCTAASKVSQPFYSPTWFNARSLTWVKPKQAQGAIEVILHSSWSSLHLLNAAVYIITQVVLLFIMHLIMWFVFFNAVFLHAVHT